MMLEQRQVEYGTHVIEYRLERRERTTLEITVEPDGLVRVTAPSNAAVEDIAARVRRRARWILAQQASFSRFRPHTPPRIYVPGETHLYLGRQYRIRVVPPEAGKGAPKASGTPSVKMVRGFWRCVASTFTTAAPLRSTSKSGIGSGHKYNFPAVWS
jgi:predicted metal-dependent hydrolase